MYPDRLAPRGSRSRGLPKISTVVSKFPFDFRPTAIIDCLGSQATDLRGRRPPSVTFGRTEGDAFTWERTDRADELRKTLMPKRGR